LRLELGHTLLAGRTVKALSGGPMKGLCPVTLVRATEIHVAQGQAVFSCPGLGSSIGLVVYCCASGVSGVLHAMLPETLQGRAVDRPGKYVDHGVAELVRLMTEKGAHPVRLVAAVVGGACVFRTGETDLERIDIGLRNERAMALALEQHRVKTIATDTGGSNGRSVTADISNLTVTVRTLDAGERILCNLRG
jgi:chemotaxis protein CheD